ncbi:MAG: hypothetical protein AAB606_03710 [Patescibacteria group bacterium]
MAHRRKISIGLIIGMVCALIGISMTLIFDIRSTLAAAPAISSATFTLTAGTNDRILVQFNMPVFGTANGTGNLDCNDFTFTDLTGSGFTTLLGGTCTHTAGNDWAVLEFVGDTAVDGDTADTITPVAGAIFTVGGALPNKAVNLTTDATAPTYTVRYKVGDDKVLVLYNEPVFSCSGVANTFTDTAISNSSLQYGEGTGGLGNSPATYFASGNRRYAIVDLTGDLTSADVTGVTDEADKISQMGSALCDALGNAQTMLTKVTLGDANSTADSTVPTISSVEAVKDGTRVLVNFSEPVFTAAAADTMASLDNTTITNDLTYTDTGGGGKTLSAAPAINHVAGNNWILLTLSGAVTAADLNSDTIAAANGTGAIVDTFSNNMAATAVALNDTTSPTITGITKNTTNTSSDGQNTVTITYSEDITITGGPAAGASAASSTTVGNMTTSCTIAGFGAFAGGNMTYKTARNTVALNAAGNAITITFAGQTGGYRTSTDAQTACSGIFTPTTNVVDLASTPNTVSASSTHASLSETNAWNTGTPATVQVPAGTGSVTSIALTWTALGVVVPNVREYKFFYGTSTGAGANFGGTEWGAVQDATLGTRTTAATSIAGLTSVTTYYITPYVVNTFGATLAGSEISVATTTDVPIGGSGYRDGTPAGVPTGLKGEFKDGNVVLTWTDPTDTDLKDIEISKGYPTRGISFSPVEYARASKGANTYVDTKPVLPGEKLEYALRSIDTSNNFSGFSSIITVTVPAATAVVTPPIVTTPVLTTDNEFVDVPTSKGRILKDMYANAITQIVKSMVENNVYKFPTDKKYYPYNRATALLTIQLALAVNGKSCEGGIITAANCVAAIIEAEILTEDSTLSKYPTRAEFYAMLLKAAGIELLEPADITKKMLCKDVTAKSQYAQVIATARKYRIASVYTGSMCYPNKAFLKYEAATYAARALLAK